MSPTTVHLAIRERERKITTRRNEAGDEGNPMSRRSTRVSRASSLLPLHAPLSLVVISKGGTDVVKRASNDDSAWMGARPRGLGGFSFQRDNVKTVLGGMSSKGCW